MSANFSFGITMLVWIGFATDEVAAIFRKDRLRVRVALKVLLLAGGGDCISTAGSLFSVFAGIVGVFETVG
jgi:hypothetical protein